MKQIKDRYCMFNGVQLKNYNWEIVSVGSDYESNIGIDVNVNMEDGFSSPIIKGVKHNTITFPITFMKTNGSSLLNITSSDWDRLCKLLYFNEPRDLVVGDRIYRGFFLKGTEWYNGSKGYATFDFQMSTPYVLSPVIIHKFKVKANESQTIVINNKSTVDEPCYPTIEFQRLSNGYKVFTFENLLNESKNYLDFEWEKYYEKIKNSILVANEQLQIFHADINVMEYTPIKKLGYFYDDLRFNHTQWLTLNVGINKIRINSGEDIDGEIRYQRKYGFK